MDECAALMVPAAAAAIRAASANLMQKRNRFLTLKFQ